MTLSVDQIKQINDFASKLLEGYEPEPVRNSEGLNIWMRKAGCSDLLNHLSISCVPDEYIYDYHYNWIYEHILHLSTCDDPEDKIPEDERPHAYYYNWLSQNNAEFVDDYVQREKIDHQHFSLIKILEVISNNEEMEMYYTILHYIKCKLGFEEE